MYPTKELFPALNVLKLAFDVSEHDELYVDFDGLRSAAAYGQLMVKLGIFRGELFDQGDYPKILYTGHTGSGKSTELKKMHNKINSPKQYFSIYLDLEDYIAIPKYKSEDFLVILITSLVSELDKRNIDYNVAGLNKIVNDWLSDEELNTEIINKISHEGGVGGELSTGGLLKFISAKLTLKSIFSYDSKTATVVRRKMRENQREYFNSFNLAILEIRKNIREAGFGRDIIFIIDGIEKLRLDRYDIYLETFFQNSSFITGLTCSLICCVPIDSLYDPKTSPLANNYNHFTLPLISIDENTIGVFRRIVTNRVDETTFFEEGVLDYCVRKSGGSPRQLLRIVYESLTYSSNNNFIITQQIAETICRNLGLDLIRRLTTPHFERLKSLKYEDGDKETLELLIYLALMEYNGGQNNRKPNPILEPFL